MQITSEIGKVKIEVKEAMTIKANAFGWAEIPFGGKYTAEGVLKMFTSVRWSPMNKKACFKQAGEVLGVSCAKVANMLNGAVYNAYIKPNRKEMSRWAFNGQVFNTMNARKVLEKREIIEEYYQDGNTHLAGFSLLFGTAEESKKALGKGLWRKLAKNSKSRNDMIVRSIMSSSAHKWHKDTVQYLETIPSTLFRVVSTEWVNRDVSIKDIIQYLDRPLREIQNHDIDWCYDMARDTKRMLGDRFNPKWGLKRMEKEHEKEVKIIHERKSSPEPFAYCAKMPLKVKGDNGFTAYLVKSAKDLVSLGMTENHCVGTFAGACRRATYCVYVIVNNNNDEVATFGSGKLPTQLYHAWDRQVTDSSILLLTKKLKKIIDKTL